VSVPSTPGNCQDFLELQLAIVPTALTVVGEACRSPVRRLLCEYVYKSCDANKKSICPSVAKKVLDETVCSVTERKVLAGLITAPSSVNFTGILASLPAIATSPPVSACSPQYLPTPVARCEQYAGAVCSDVLKGSSVYVSPDKPQFAVESRLAPLAAALPSAPLTCLPKLLDFLCSTAFPTCVEVDVGPPFSAMFTHPPPFPSLPCRSLCQSFVADCGSFWSAFKLGAVLPLPNCSSVGSTFVPPVVACGRTLNAGAVDFPVESSQFLPSPPISTVCNPGALELNRTNSQALLAAVQCPDPLVRPESPASTQTLTELVLPGAVSSCATPCVSFFFTESQWVSTEVAFTVICVLSLLANTFVLLTWTLFAEKRKQKFVQYFIGNVWGVSFAMVMGIVSMATSGYRLRDITCFDNANTNQQQLTSGALVCVTQGVVIFWCVHSGVAWWTLQAVDLFQKIVQNRRFNYSTPAGIWRIRIFHLFGFGWPTLMLVVALALGVIGGSGTVPYCLFVEDSFPNEWFLFYGPILLQGVVVFGMMGRVLQQIWRIHKSIGAGNNRGASTWNKFSRPVYFCIMFCLVFGFIVAYNGEMSRKRNQFLVSGKAYVQCILQGGTRTPGSCGEVPSGAPVLFFWKMLIYVVAGQGLLFFALYGTMAENYKLWKTCLTGGGIGRKKAGAGGLSGSSQTGPNPTSQNKGLNRYESVANSVDAVELATIKPALKVSKSNQGPQKK